MKKSNKKIKPADPNYKTHPWYTKKRKHNKIEFCKSVESLMKDKGFDVSSITGSNDIDEKIGKCMDVVVRKEFDHHSTESNLL